MLSLAFHDSLCPAPPVFPQQGSQWVKHAGLLAALCSSGAHCEPLFFFFVGHEYLRLHIAPLSAQRLLLLSS